VDLIRHGQPVGGQRYRGQIDDPLSDLGWQQMWSAVGDDPPWSGIVSSPLARCLAFARALGERAGIPVTEEPRFKEVRFGSWEGRNRRELEAEAGEAVARFYHDPVHARPAGAEPLADFLERVHGAWDALLARHAGEHVLVVTHAGVVRAVLTRVLAIPPASLYRVHVPNAGITRIALPPDRPPTLLFHGGRLPP
jgi:alpha-ribazole phosphatase/probable phosphoglycerate mutase